VSALDAVPAPPGVRVEVRADLNHQCPFKPETDRGTALLTWTTTDITIELHSLRSWLSAWAAEAISHEDLVQRVADALAACGVAEVRVQATYPTAGMEVTVGAVPRDPLGGARA
jgi:NADPH-dependent 7-cyano-7-deazaguanine reductase QueF